ncbi:MAG TPA: hypothetical protein VMU92_09305 [Acidobacteriaceae bacterium]|nr:hypothetical protein [Acidobacteriaceae bacterium]
MTIELRPELEALVLKDIQLGLYGSVEEYLEKAVMLLHNQEAWLSSHRNEIAAKIEEGWQAAERGEITTYEQLTEELRRRKRA